MNAPRPHEVTVVGQIARDLVLVIDDVPNPLTSTRVRERHETLGGKGANQAVSLAQLGASVALLGVVATDHDATRVLARAQADGIDTDPVIHRTDGRTALIVDIVDRQAHWRYLEDIPEDMLLRADDIHANTATLTSARAVIVQLQQPPEAALAAATTATGLVVLDGAAHGEILANADILRADDHEAELIAGRSLDTPDDALEIGRDLLDQHDRLRLVALGAGKHGNVFVWPDGSLTLPLDEVPVADTTGAGDALIAALTLALIRGAEPEAAAGAAVAASAHTVRHPGGRPALSPDLIPAL